MVWIYPWMLIETVARRRSAALLSEFGLGHVREYAPFSQVGLGALRAPSPHPQAYLGTLAP